MNIKIDQLEDSNVCIIGLGYVGLTLAVVMADVGFQVHGVEINDDIRDCIAQGKAHFSEVGIDKRIAALVARGALTTSKTLTKECKATVYIITVGTPVDEDKRTKLDSIKQVASDVAKVLKDGDMVILRSTVRVGVSEDVVKPILDSTGVSYDLAFCPERTIEGKAIEELRSLPQVVGGMTQASTLRASRLFHMLTPSVVRVSSLKAAEMIKLVNNTHRDIMFAFANEIALAADAAGLSAREVITASNLGYPRGGVKSPGPVGGPCLEKDPYILAEGLQQHGFTPELSLAGRRLNEALPSQVTNKLKSLSEKRDMKVRKVCVLGLAFKGQPETSDLRGTLAKPLIANVRETFPDAEISGWDPAVKPEESVKELDLEMSDSLAHAVSEADIVIIQTNHRRFDDLDFAETSSGMRERGIIFDLWAMNEDENLPLKNGVAYACYGSSILIENA